MRNDEIAYVISQYTPLLDQAEEFVTRINWGQGQHYFQCLAAKDFDALRPFKIIRGEHDVPPLHFVSGQCDLPRDFQKEEKMYYLLDGEQVRINILGDNDFENYKTSPIEYPTKEYPIANIQSNYIRLLPKDINYAVFSYIKLFTPIVYAIDRTLGYTKYDPAHSTELEWDEFNQISIIMLVLQSLGIVATREEIQNKKK